MTLESGTLKELAIKVSQYFLDFLESDFKRQQAPRRCIVLQTDTGFKSGMRISPYPDLQRDLWKLLEKPAEAHSSIRMAPGQYKRPITATLRAIIKEQVQALAEQSLEVVRLETISKAQASKGNAIENPELWVDEIRRSFALEIGTQIISPLLALLDGPLSNQAYSVHDSIYATESELIELVAAKVDPLLPEILSRYLANGDLAELQAILEAELSIEGVRSALTEYFEKYMAADAFLEFRDLETYAATGENLQLYIYIGTLKYGNSNFPLFYAPVEVTRDANTGIYSFGLVSHLYANKRAIDFILQELGARILEVAQPLFRQILNVLDLGGQIDLTPEGIASVERYPGSRDAR